MSKTKEEETSITRSVLHTTGEILTHDKNWLSRFLGTVVGGSLLLSFAGDVTNEISTAPDETGSAEETRVLEEHAKSFSELKAAALAFEHKKSDINVNKKYGVENSVDLKAEQDKLNDMARLDLINLYLKGATSEGAAISEVKFEELYDKRMDLLRGTVDYNAIGLGTRIYAAKLDETLSELNINYPANMDLVSQFNAVKEINESMREDMEKEAYGIMAGILAIGLGGGLGVFGLLSVGGSGLKRISPTKPKRLGNH